MKRRFNTTGPCVVGRHYMIPAERRLPEAPGLVEQMGYFVVHAPRQTGKTTALMALARELSASGRYAAVLTSCEEGQAAGDKYGSAQRALLRELVLSAAANLPVELQPPPLALEGEEGLVAAYLTAWARACPRPIVLILDEIDALQGASLLSVLRQLRAGFPRRPEGFPAAVILCGLRGGDGERRSPTHVDVRDYKAASGGDPERLGTASPFNVKLKSLRVGDFTPDEVRELYAQHTADTGQVFTEDALARAIEVTAGQPWLVNALAAEIVDEMAVPKEEAIRIAHVEQAKERLILARATHLDSLVSKLEEPRVRKVIEPVLAGTLAGGGPGYHDDLEYARDLGILAPDNPARIANPIYREVVARVLASDIEPRIAVEPRSFLLPDGQLDMDHLLHEFAEFWRQHAEVLEDGLVYHEVAPQLVLMAYLQRIVNGGGYVDRDYGVGRGRIDLCVRMPYTGSDGKRAFQREALELKVWAPGRRDPLPQGLKQLEGYLDQLGLDRGVLVIFDRRPEAGSSEERTRFEEARTEKGYAVTVLRA